MMAAFIGRLVCLALTFSLGLSIPGKRHEILRNLLSNGTGSFYDNKMPPNFDDDFPTDVTVQIYVLSFDSVSETSMAFSVTIFLRQNWTDHRLDWEDDSLTDRLEVDPSFIDHLWIPDLYFINERKAEIHDVTEPNKMLHIYKNGTIHLSMRITMTLGCDMHLQKYPHDEQVCSFIIGSYSYSEENVAFNWHNIPVMIRPGMVLPRFTGKFGKIWTSQLMYNEGSVIQGNYSCIQADFYLQRQFGYYIAQVYVPSVLIVVLSWVSFWIDMHSTPARVSLGLLTVLAITTQSTGEKTSLPKVSYIKGIDVWMAVCLAFVFAALLEFAFVNVQSRLEKRRKDSGGARTGMSNNGADIDASTETVGKDTSNPAPQRRILFLGDTSRADKARFVDKCSRVVFPTLFIIFNLIYWIYYTV